MIFNALRKTWTQLGPSWSLDIEGATGKVVHTEGGAPTRRDTHKAVRGHHSSRVIEGATGNVVQTEGGAPTRRDTQKAVCGHHRSQVI